MIAKLSGSDIGLESILRVGRTEVHDNFHGQPTLREESDVWSSRRLWGDVTAPSP